MPTVQRTKFVNQKTSLPREARSCEVSPVHDAKGLGLSFNFGRHVEQAVFTLEHAEILYADLTRHMEWLRARKEQFRL